MSKIKVAVMALLCITMLAGCGSKEASTKDSEENKTVTVDIESLADKLATDITYEDTLEQVDDDTIGFYVDVADGVKSVMYMGTSGKTAEEVAVFEATDEDTAIQMKENVQTFLDDQGESFQDYIPEEADRVENAVLVQNGNYVVLCVCGTPDDAQSIIDKAFK